MEYVLGLGGACVVHGTHLLCLKIYQTALKLGWQGEMVGSFSQGRCSLGLGSAWRGVGRLSMGYGSKMSQGSVLFDALPSSF
jgi:hypothetical protein